MLKIPELTDKDMAVGSIKHMPRYESVPERFKEMFNEPYVEFVNTWFFKGADRGRLTPKKGVDANKALMACKAVMASLEPKHEHKTAAVAYMLWNWFYLDGMDTCMPVNMETLDTLYVKYQQYWNSSFNKTPERFGQYFMNQVGFNLPEDFRFGDKEVNLWEEKDPIQAYNILAEYMRSICGDVQMSRCSAPQANFAVVGDASAINFGSGILYWHIYKEAALHDARTLKKQGCKVRVNTKDEALADTINGKGNR